MIAYPNRTFNQMSNVEKQRELFTVAIVRRTNKAVRRPCVYLLGTNIGFTFVYVKKIGGRWATVLLIKQSQAKCGLVLQGGPEEAVITVTP